MESSRPTFDLPDRTTGDEHPPLTQFTCFEKLPHDIRSKIWLLAFPTRRFIIIQLQEVTCKYVDELKGRRMCGTFSTPTPFPALAPGADQEMIAEFERQQGPCFTPSVFHSRESLGLPGTISFSYSMDVAFFSRGPAPTRSNPLDFLGSADVARIEQIAVELESPHWTRFIKLLPEMVNLKRFFLIINKENKLIDGKQLIPVTEKMLPLWGRHGPYLKTSGYMTPRHQLRCAIESACHDLRSSAPVRDLVLGIEVDPRKQLRWDPWNQNRNHAPRQFDVLFEIFVLMSEPLPMLEPPPEFLLSYPGRLDGFGWYE